MIIGYQFINRQGYPVGNVQPTLEEAEAVAKFEGAGCFYTINKSDGEEDGTIFMCLVGRKSIVPLL